jgi:putative CocE/NonD family hydrolase
MKHHVPTVLITLALALGLFGCTRETTPTATLAPRPTATQTPAFTPTLMPAVRTAERLSRFGVYKGYSEPLFDGYERISQYVEVRDGTPLAADVYRPTADGELVQAPLPVIWTHTRYQRAQQLPGGRIQEGFYTAGELIPYGYVVAVADVRGSGASFGVRSAEFTPEEAMDAYDITEWLATRPWSDGNVGMFGRSYLGISQLFAASQAPPHLRAIFPEMHMFDIYDLVHQNGVYAADFVENWDPLVRGLDKGTLAQVAPVDDDPDGERLAQALALREQNSYPLDLVPAAPYRDSPTPGVGSWATISPNTYIDAINASGVAIYQLGGWFDMYTTDALLWYANLEVPQRLVMPDWQHQDLEEWLLIEMLRWFDYWLKGIDNGIMDEPSIYYRSIGEREWQATNEWPLPEEQRTEYFFHAGPSGSIDSVNDGLLLPETPTDPDGRDEYTIDYETSVGPNNRFAAGYGGRFGYGNLARNDKRALTYTTPPLVVDVEVTGHPVARLVASSTAEDGDFFVYLEEVDEHGYAHYVTEGKLRASHRALGEPPFENMGLPWHRSYAQDVVPMPEGEPVELVFDLRPTSIVFDKGHRMRVTLTGADSGTFETPRLDPPPTISVLRSADYASLIELPVIPPTGAHQPPPSGVGAQTADGVSDWGPPVAVSALVLVALVYGHAARRSFIRRENKRKSVTVPGVRASWYVEPRQQQSSFPSWHTDRAGSIANESSTAKFEMATTASRPAILTVAGPAHALVVAHRNAWRRTLSAQSEWDGELGVARVGNDGAGHRNSALDTAWDGDPASGFSLN